MHNSSQLLSEDVAFKLFSNNYLSDGGLLKLKRIALEGNLSSNYLRSLAWRIWLGVLPSPVSFYWNDIILNSRKKYHNLVNKYDKETLIIDPLLTNASVSERIMLKKKIQKDIDRLYNTIEYFQSTSLRNKLSRLLYIFAREHCDLGYQQGFHELVGVLFSVIERDSSITMNVIYSKEHEQEYEEGHEQEMINLFRTVLNSNEIESDTYIIFEKLMTILGSCYEQKKVGEVSTSSNIHFRCEKLFQSIAKYDPEYYHVLMRHNVIPAVFGLRWIKMLFAREFHIDDVIIVWDTLFSFGHQLKLVDSMFVVMLLYIRNDIIERDDESYSMRRLMKYPPVEDLKPLIELSVGLAEHRVSMDGKTIMMRMDINSITNAQDKSIDWLKQKKCDKEVVKKTNSKLDLKKRLGNIQRSLVLLDKGNEMNTQLIIDTAAELAKIIAEME
ncbi:Rab GTPase activating protein [Entamoeba marina]